MKEKRDFEVVVMGGYGNEVIDENGYIGYKCILKENGVIVEESEIYDSIDNLLIDLYDIERDWFDNYNVSNNGGDGWKIKMDVLVV